MVKIEYPMLWLSQIARAHYTSPWKSFKVDGILMNAYDFMQHPVLFEEVKKKKIHGFLNYDGPVLMDSGGFLFMKKKIMNVHAKQIIDFYEESKPNFGVVLDHPLIPTLPKKELMKRKLKTLKNTKIMMNNKTTKNPVLIPVIHGYEQNEIKWYLKKLAKIDSFPIYGIGSLVPSLYNVKGVGGILNVVKVISEIRKQIPDARLHVFGTGGTLTMHLMYYAGADSLDSSAWRTKAAFGAIQMAGMGDRWITKAERKKPYPQLSGGERKKLENCKCPACKKDGFRGLQKSFSSRALHNAWVHQQEVRKARKLIKENRYEEYVSKIMKKTWFSNLFLNIKKIQKNEKF
jgi:7-cyano-7-deazaguanine tRNA-ribosyltransferase